MNKLKPSRVMEALKPDTCSPEPVPEADPYCVIAATITSPSAKTPSLENNGKETPGDLHVQLVNGLEE